MCEYVYRQCSHIDSALQIILDINCILSPAAMTMAPVMSVRWARIIEFYIAPFDLCLLGYPKLAAKHH